MSVDPDDGPAGTGGEPVPPEAAETVEGVGDAPEWSALPGPTGGAVTAILAAALALWVFSVLVGPSDAPTVPTVPRPTPAQACRYYAPSDRDIATAMASGTATTASPCTPSSSSSWAPR